eukprot:2786538-Pyramimonas_sp.AAC.1
MRVTCTREHVERHAMRSHGYYRCAIGCSSYTAAAVALPFFLACPACSYGAQVLAHFQRHVRPHCARGSWHPLALLRDGRRSMDVDKKHKRFEPEGKSN